MNLREVREKCLKFPDCIFMYQYRYLSTIITFILVHTSITPNQVTLISFILGLVSLPFFLSTSYFQIVIGIIIFQLSYILDAVDGEIARFKNLKSEFGSWFDTASDSIILLGVISASSLGAYNASKDPLILIMSLFSVIGISSLLILQSIKSDKVKIKSKKSIKLSSKYYIGMYTPMILIISLGILLQLYLIMYLLIILFSGLGILVIILSRYKLLK